MICTRCDADLPTTSFWRNRSTARGYQNWCVSCLSPRNYPKKKATSKRWEQRHARPGNGSRPEPRPRINRGQKLVRDHLHLATNSRDYLSGLAYLVLLAMAKLHGGASLPPGRFRSLVLCRIQGERKSLRMKEAGYHKSYRGPRLRREVCFTDLGWKQRDELEQARAIVPTDDDGEWHPFAPGQSANAEAILVGQVGVVAGEPVGHLLGFEVGGRLLEGGLAEREHLADVSVEVDRHGYAEALRLGDVWSVLRRDAALADGLDNLDELRVAGGA